MGKKHRKKNKSKIKCTVGMPKVSICTPTYNRRRFIPFLIQCYERTNLSTVTYGMDCGR